MVDIFNLPGALSEADFEFKNGNSADPMTWASAPAPLSISIRPGEGINGTDRVTIIFADGAISKQWLQVKVLANENTGLTADDVFYFGNAIGESGDSAVDAIVDATDEIAARNNPRTFMRPAGIENICDFNRDGKVDATDQIVSRNNVTDFSNDLELISP